MSEIEKLRREYYEAETLLIQDPDPDREAQLHKAVRALIAWGVRRSYRTDPRHTPRIVRQEAYRIAVEALPEEDET